MIIRICTICCSQDMLEHQLEVIEFLTYVFFSFFCRTIQFGFSRNPYLEVSVLHEIIEKGVNPCLRDQDLVPAMNLVNDIIP